MIAPRLSLMRELLSDRGSIYVHLDYHVVHYVKLLLDDLFGKENFRQRDHLEAQGRGSALGSMNRMSVNTDTILYYSIIRFVHLQPHLHAARSGVCGRHVSPHRERSEVYRRTSMRSPSPRPEPHVRLQGLQDSAKRLGCSPFDDGTSSTLRVGSTSRSLNPSRFTRRSTSTSIQGSWLRISGRTFHFSRGRTRRSSTMARRSPKRFCAA